MVSIAAFIEFCDVRSAYFFILSLACRQKLQEQPDNPLFSHHSRSRITAENILKYLSMTKSMAKHQTGGLTICIVEVWNL